MRLQLKDKYFPVQAFLNSISDADFVASIKRLSEGIGAGYNDANCHFAGDQEPDEPLFEGAHLQIFEDEIYLSWLEFKSFVEMACEAYLKDFPKDRQALDGILDRFPRSNADLDTLSQELTWRQGE